jgi:S-DNA-T family DNA segregation ATPase FtsK/SpoIIIE
MLKGMGAAASAFAAWKYWSTIPDNAFRRKLTHVYHTGELCLKIPPKRKGQLEKKIYPKTTRVVLLPDPDKPTEINRYQATILLPDGMAPDFIFKHEFLFKQVFGEYAFLKEETAKIMTLTVYTKDLEKYDYNFTEIKPLLKDMLVPVYAGKSRVGDVVYDMVDVANLLIAGEPGGGKSVALRSILTTFILCIQKLELYCADMKFTEFHLFEGVADKVVYEEKDLLKILRKLDKERMARGKKLKAAGLAHVRDFPEDERPPFIILAIDEVAILEEKDTFKLIKKIASQGRALGMYVILSMQRPDRETLDTYIKNCLTVRMAFRHGDITNSQVSLGPGHGEAAEIKPSQKGRAALLLESVDFVQMPFLDLQPARQLLTPYKTKEVEVEPEEDEEEDESL